MELTTLETVPGKDILAGLTIVLLAIGVLAGRANERKHFRELEESERARRHRRE